MEPIQDKNYFEDVNLQDLLETQRQITLRIQKIGRDDSEQVENLKRELYHWTKQVLYEKAKFLCRKVDKLKSRINKAKDILET